MNTSLSSEPARPRAWLRWLLIVSLACNLAVAGLVAGAAIKFRDGPPRAFDLSIGPLARALDREDRRWIARELFDRQGLRPPGAAERAAEAERLAAAVRADPFDAAAFTAALADMAARADALQQAAQDVLVARVAALPVAARVALADRLLAEAAEGPPAAP